MYVPTNILIVGEIKTVVVGNHHYESILPLDPLLHKYLPCLQESKLIINTVKKRMVSFEEHWILPLKHHIKMYCFFLKRLVTFSKVLP